jgi:hypothetical protein
VRVRSPAAHDIQDNAKYLEVLAIFGHTVRAVSHVTVRQMTMAKVASIDAPAKRAKLTAAKNPYWRGIGHGRGRLCLGYRKPTHGPGTWVAKIVQGGKRAEERIGSRTTPALRWSPSPTPPRCGLRSPGRKPASEPSPPLTLVMPLG